jgi:hypothetical protein
VQRFLDRIQNFVIQGRLGTFGKVPFDNSEDEDHDETGDYRGDYDQYGDDQLICPSGQIQSVQHFAS